MRGLETCHHVESRRRPQQFDRTSGFKGPASKICELNMGHGIPSIGNRSAGWVCNREIRKDKTEMPGDLR